MSQRYHPCAKVNMERSRGEQDNDDEEDDGDDGSNDEEADGDHRGGNDAWVTPLSMHVLNVSFGICGGGGVDDTIASADRTDDVINRSTVLSFRPALFAPDITDTSGRPP